MSTRFFLRTEIDLGAKPPVSLCLWINGNTAVFCPQGVTRLEYRGNQDNGSRPGSQPDRAARCDTFPLDPLSARCEQVGIIR
jgi:hypothetical protein